MSTENSRKIVVQHLTSCTVILAMIISTITRPASAEDVVRIWVKAFIPNEHPTISKYIVPIPGQPGKFMLPAPFKDSALAQATGLFQACFSTDHRSFSDDAAALARVTTDVTLTIAGKMATLKPSTSRGLQFADLSHKLDCSTGKDVQSARTASLDNCGVGEPAAADGIVTVTLGCSAKDPFYNGTPAPTLDYNGIFTYDVSKKTLAFKGDVGTFPSFEAYASLNGKHAQQLFRFPPAPKSDTMSLYDLWLGLNTRRVDVAPVFLDIGTTTVVPYAPTCLRVCSDRDCPCPNK